MTRSALLAMALAVAAAAAPDWAAAAPPEPRDGPAPASGSASQTSVAPEPDAIEPGGGGAATAAADTARVELARSHFQRGVDLYRSGAYDAAFAEFMRAHELAPNHRILYNLAQVQAQRHDYVEALSFFQRYLDAGGAQVPPDRAEEVRAEMAELGRRVSRLRVETNVDDAHLFVNGLAAGDLPREQPLLLNSGIHRLRVEKPGYVSASRVVTLAGGEESYLGLELTAELDIDDLAAPAQPAPAPAPVPAPPDPAVRHVDRTALWTSLVATGALTGASVTFGLLTRRASATLDDQLSRFPAPRSSVAAARTRVRTFALLTDGFGAAAAAALGLSTYLFLSTDAASDEGPARNGLRAQIGPRASSVVWLGAF